MVVAVSLVAAGLDTGFARAWSGRPEGSTGPGRPGGAAAGASGTEALHGGTGTGPNFPGIGQAKLTQVRQI